MGSRRGAMRLATFGLLLGLAVIVLNAILCPGPATAAVDDAIADETVFLPTDRASVQRLNLARELIDQRRWGEAVRLIGSLLEAPE
ncbi:MAG TPA: hypothetical protein VG713_14760, partial [Pirellulales bacterium]|nr:hypothetical protein [Pirellulales bacterium]